MEASLSNALVEMPAVSIYPFECPLCGFMIQSATDRTEWHGLGNCTDICSLCDGEGEVKKSQCPLCAGAGTERTGI